MYSSILRYGIRIYGIHIHRWREFHPPADEPAAREAGIATPLQKTLWIGMVRDAWTSEVNAFEINDGFYFSLADSGYIHGYAHRIEEGRVYIDTMEPNISEYGFNVARDFLSARPTLFIRDMMDWWDDEIREATPALGRTAENWPAFPFSYRLYDFNSDGIPEIIIWYDWEAPGIWGVHVMYTYENGEFTPVGELSYWGELFTDGQGNFYYPGGSHQEGFARIVHFAFTDEGVIWEIFAERGANWSWEVGQLPEDERTYLIEQVQAIWNEFSFSPPSFRGVPLTVVKPFELPELFYAAAQNSIVPQEIPAIYTETESPEEYPEPVEQQEEIQEEIQEETQEETQEEIQEETTPYSPPINNSFTIWMIGIPLAAIGAISFAIIISKKRKK
jgi:hypothetical protein